MKMKLYVYEDCALCLRLRMLIGLKQLACEVIMVAPGQWPPSLCQTLPTLKAPRLMLSAETGERWIEPSAEIIAQLAEATDTPQLMESGEDDSDAASRMVALWCESNGALLDKLCLPRLAERPLKAWQTPAGRAEWIERSEGRMGLTLSQAKALTPRWLDALIPQLVPLEDWLKIDALLAETREVNAADLHAYAALRDLILVSELALSERLLAYLDALARRSGVPLWSQHEAASTKRSELALVDA
ncbi:glutathione S-transferase N-terminal domain-containing protein [Ferrimonas pelagia]|uniref:Glutaredoxin 2 n=1 Tax=Ferrimonas pelagia TaxID=1177826 RepID=A0ABP9FCI4_9GAMM